MDKIDEIITKISHIEELEKINEILNENINVFEMEFFLLGIATPKSLSKTDILIIDNYPQSWRSFYDTNSLAKKDPVVNYSLKYHSPILWSHLKEEDYSADEWNIFSLAKESGLTCGFSIPIHGNGNQFGMFSMASSQTLSDEKLLSSQVMVQQIIPFIQDSINRLTNPPSKMKPSLTPREVECLKWASEGKSGWEMSKIMNCTERTISFHITNVGKKLNANNRTQSIAKAILLGYLIPPLDY